MKRRMEFAYEREEGKERMKAARAFCRKSLQRIVARKMWQEVVQCMGRMVKANWKMCWKWRLKHGDQVMWGQ